MKSSGSDATVVGCEERMEQLVSSVEALEKRSASPRASRSHFFVLLLFDMFRTCSYLFILCFQTCFILMFICFHVFVCFVLFLEPSLTFPNLLEPSRAFLDLLESSQTFSNCLYLLRLSRNGTKQWIECENV